ncbi:MAG TPA: hypothetical protein VJ806_05345 [Luteimonas sp.]|nr:hypothetical protein [Luteimonas sp.]
MNMPIDTVGRQAPVQQRNDPNRHEVEPNEVRSVQYQGNDGKIEMHPSWRNTPLAGAMEGNTLDLSRVTPQMLRDLGPTNTNILMDSYLAGREVDIRITNGNGSQHTTEVSGATALAMQMWGSGDSVAFAKAFAANPEAVMPYLTGNGARVLTAENIALIMREMQGSATSATGRGGYDPSELDALGTLVQTYLQRNAGEDPAKVRQAVEQLIGEINKTLEFNPQNAGVVTGALISGMLKHFDQIEASDEMRNNIIGGVADTLGAAAGGFGPWGAAVGTGIAALKGIYLAANPPRDNAEVASRLQGAIQLEWLQYPPQGWSRDDVQDAVNWVNTTILNNGQR